MAINVDIDLAYEFEVKAKAAEVFAVLSDVPTSVSHFPKVDKLTDMGDGVYKWEMKKWGLRRSISKPYMPASTLATKPKAR